MTVKELKEKLNLQYICNECLAEEKTVTGCYCGDLLSWVMSRATEGDAWLTVMGNVTSRGVAVLADVDNLSDDDEDAFEASLFEDDAEKVLRDEDFTAFTEYEEELEEDDEAFLKSILGG